MLVIAGVLLAAGAALSYRAAAPEWSFNATIIEACSCPMFCQCYFGSKPAEHAGHGGSASGHFCRFSNAFKVNRGSFGAVKLDGVKFWVSGDLGGDFSKGQMDWAVATFDRAATKEQRDAIGVVLGHVYPVKWNSFTTAEAAMDWSHTGDTARATLDAGKVAEVRLRRFPGMTADPVVIKNLKYWGVPRNDGFVLMPNEIEAYRAGAKPYEFRGTNGFMITIDINSGDVPPPKTASLR
jgi:hypothetical protein